MSLAPSMGCLFPHVQFEYTLLNISVISVVEISQCNAPIQRVHHNFLMLFMVGFRGHTGGR